MKLVTTWFGSFLLDEREKIVQHRLFPKEPEAIASRLTSISAGEVLAEETELAQDISPEVAERRLSTIGVFIEFDRPEIKQEDFGFDMSVLGKAMQLKGREKVKAKTTPDEHIIQAIRATDDLTKIINLMSERLHEWHALNFPELTALVPESKYIELVAEFGSREAILASGAVNCPDSLGAPMSEADVAAVKSLAGSIRSLSLEKQEVERYIEGRMKEIAPNLSHLAGPLIGARLMSLTGGMDRLSRLPSSTLQLLGAEKALFKHLKENARPPKHGVIFQHPIIHRAPPWQRGKIARVFAAKLSMAVKLDRYGGEFMGPKLEIELKKRVEDIKAKHPKPKPRPAHKGKRKHGGR